MKGKNIRKLAAFMSVVMLASGLSGMSTFAATAPDRASILNCPIEGAVKSASTAESMGVKTLQWEMADGRIVYQDSVTGEVTVSGEDFSSDTAVSQGSLVPNIQINTTTVDNSTNNYERFGLKEDTFSNLMAQMIFDIVNEQREKEGLPKFVWSTGLQEEAKVRAKEITENFSHVRDNNKNLIYGYENIQHMSPSNLMLHADDYVKKNIDKLSVSNDVYNMYLLARSSVNWFMESPGHRKPIMDNRVDEVGEPLWGQSLAVGVYCYDNQIWVVMDWGDQFLVDSTVPSDLADNTYINPLMTEEELALYNEIKDEIANISEETDTSTELYSGNLTLAAK